MNKSSRAAEAFASTDTTGNILRGAKVTGVVVGAGAAIITVQSLFTYAFASLGEKIVDAVTS